MPVPKVEPWPVVCALDQRKHLPTVMDIEAAASADRRRIYEGQPWTVGGFREYLHGGQGLVALNANRTVVGFAMYHRKGDCLIVTKLVAQTRLAEDAMLSKLWERLRECGLSFLDLPLILDIPV